ncbi:hypothetical protein FOI68_22315 [Brevibacillus sp. LEMMJ03]|uniref:phage terminase small subunit-related protein n=1 Tax=Brevibacillus sp. LEMMJ03 TaxID=2595056 RepID=UPI00117C4F8B|nr:hypothetical protein FOI68_22315 [Brevibacillus sp. LEMMJ03]
MPRERNPNRDRAYQIWLEHNGNMKVDILSEKRPLYLTKKPADPVPFRNFVCRLERFDPFLTKRVNRCIKLLLSLLPWPHF